MAGEAVTGTGAVSEREPRSKARAGGRRRRGEEGRGRKCCDGPENALSDAPSERVRPRHGEGAGRGALWAGPAAWSLRGWRRGA